MVFLWFFHQGAPQIVSADPATIAELAPHGLHAGLVRWTERGGTMILGKFHHELTTSSLEIIVSKGNHPQMALIQVSELL